MPKQNPKVSVVICTRNRAELLRKAIESVVSQDFPHADYEILVVDNGSTDETPEVVKEFHDRAPIWYVREQRIGLCIARNTGWRAAAGHYIAFLDDDAVARPGWLRAISEAFQDGLEIGVVGGRVYPIWEVDPPSWLADDVARVLTIIDWGPNNKIITDLQHEWVAGANMAIPKTVLSEVGGFHPSLDRVGNNLLSSGDVFLQKQILRNGLFCRYVPKIAVDHQVPASRLNQRWFKERFFWQGVSEAIIYVVENAPSLTERFRIALIQCAKLTKSWRRLIALMLRTTRPRIFRAKCLILLDIGFIFGLLGRAGR
jgi:glycosyltransferase involved in cell wall biosynthesis